jgi:hypothetical protein
MPWSLRTRLSQAEPPEVVLTVRGQARVRVRGNAYGLLRCAGEARWVFGAFDQTFRLRRAGELKISALGVGGYASTSVRFLPGPDLTAGRIPARARLRWTAPRVPRLRALTAREIRALAKDEDHDRA